MEEKVINFSYHAKERLIERVDLYNSKSNNNFNKLDYGKVEDKIINDCKTLSIEPEETKTRKIYYKQAIISYAVIKTVNNIFVIKTIKGICKNPDYKKDPFSRADTTMEGIKIKREVSRIYRQNKQKLKERDVYEHE